MNILLRGLLRNIKKKNFAVISPTKSGENSLETAVEITGRFTGRRQKKKIGKRLTLSSTYRENCPSNTDGTVFRTDINTTTSHEMKFRKSETRLSVCLSVFLSVYLLQSNFTCIFYTSSTNELTSSYRAVVLYMGSTNLNG